MTLAISLCVHICKYHSSKFAKPSCSAPCLAMTCPASWHSTTASAVSSCLNRSSRPLKTTTFPPGRQAAFTCKQHRFERPTLQASREHYPRDVMSKHFQLTIGESTTQNSQAASMSATAAMRVPTRCTSCDAGCCAGSTGCRASRLRNWLWPMASSLSRGRSIMRIRLVYGARSRCTA